MTECEGEVQQVATPFKCCEHFVILGELWAKASDVKWLLRWGSLIPVTVLWMRLQTKAPCVCTHANRSHTRVWLLKLFYFCGFALLHFKKCWLYLSTDLQKTNKHHVMSWSKWLIPVLTYTVSMHDTHLFRLFLSFNKQMQPHTQSCDLMYHGWKRIYTCTGRNCMLTMTNCWTHDDESSDAGNNTVTEVTAKPTSFIAL